MDCIRSSQLLVRTHVNILSWTWFSGLGLCVLTHADSADLVLLTTCGALLDLIISCTAKNCSGSFQNEDMLL